MPETTTLPLPNTPKINLRPYLATAKDSQAVVGPSVTAPTGVRVTTAIEIATFKVATALDAWLVDQPQTVTTITVPDRFTATEPIILTGPADGGGLVHLVVGEHAQVEFQDRWGSAGEHLGVWVRADIASGANVNWLSYDHFAAQTVLLQRQAELASAAVLNWTVAGFSHNSGASLLMTELNGDGAQATVNVGVLAAGRQRIGYVNAVTNHARKTVGHINQRGVITDQAHLIFNGIGHIITGAQGSDNQQENRVLMLSPAARGDANPILLIDENDVTAGHAASVTRVDARQLYYLMSRGLHDAVAKRLVIRGFLEAGLTDITDRALKQELFKTIDETLVILDDN